MAMRLNFRGFSLVCVLFPSIHCPLFLRYFALKLFLSLADFGWYGWLGGLQNPQYVYIRAYVLVDDNLEMMSK